MSGLAALIAVSASTLGWDTKMRRFRYATVAVLVALAVAAAPTAVHAGGILDSAMRHAAGVRLARAGQPSGCAAASAAGAMDGRTRQGAVGWALGGLVLPIIIPIVAHASTPQPPADAVLQYNPDDARCYSAGYSDAAGSKRKRGAWIGSGVSIGLMFTAIALVAMSNDDCYDSYC